MSGRAVPRTSSSPASRRISNGIRANTRPATAGVAKLLLLGLSQIGRVVGAPVREYFTSGHGEGPDDSLPKSPQDPDLWILLTVAMILVLAGGAFAGLTIALMGQDGIYLQVIASSGEGKEKRHAQRVFGLLKRGKHWVLVTLLLANVIVNETLPIVLDRSLGGGWPAVLGSTVLIVIFGEVIPQSICVRYGMAIGAFMSPYVLVLMYLLAPIAWPTAKLLDRLLGEDHGTVYKKAGLKTLVTLHKTLGTTPGERLNEDEVTIISAVLDLKDKPVGDIMTPMEDVFVMSADTILDEKTMDVILSAGYSRIPIYEPGNENNFIGMLLVKMLITYDPEDCQKVSDFALATLPETRPETSCLDIVNFFQEGKSHMVLVSDFPGEDHGAIGVVTLEDVIEELIGEEIIDESDVYIDVHKAIRRLQPAPTYRRGSKGYIAKDAVAADQKNIANEQNGSLIEIVDEEAPKSADAKKNGEGAANGSPAQQLEAQRATVMMRRGSSAQGERRGATPVTVRASDVREHLKHLGPSNLASRPKSTRYQSVKIKPGHVVLDNKVRVNSFSEPPYRDDPGESSQQPLISYIDGAESGAESDTLLANAGRMASDGVQAHLRSDYGSFAYAPAVHVSDTGSGDDTQSRPKSARKGGSDGDSSSQDGGKDRLGVPDGPRKKRGVARSGSITENIVDSHGVRKMILQTTSSSEGEGANDFNRPETIDETKEEGNGKDQADNDEDGSVGMKNGDKGEEVKKKKKRNRKRKGKSGGSEAGGSNN